MAKKSIQTHQGSDNTIGCGTYAAVHGAEFAGAVIGSGGVIGLVTTFIYGRNKKTNA